MTVQKITKDVIVIREEDKDELIELLGEVIAQVTDEIEKLNKEEGATLDSILLSARIVDSFESFILFLTWDRPEKSDTEVNIFYKITSKCKVFL